jgi:hypothetical protein
MPQPPRSHGRCVVLLDLRREHNVIESLSAHFWHAVQMSGGKGAPDSAIAPVPLAGLSDHVHFRLE